MRLGAVICDRCRLPASADEQRADTGLVVYWNGRPVDLCTSCKAELMAWLGPAPEAVSAR